MCYRITAQYYTRSPLQDSRLFGPRPWKVLATTYKKIGSWATQTLAKILWGGILWWRPGVHTLHVVVVHGVPCYIISHRNGIKPKLSKSNTNNQKAPKHEIDVYMCRCAYMSIYIYIYRERERCICMCITCVYIYIYIYTHTHTYIYIYIYRERERDTRTHTYMFDYVVYQNPEI